MKRRRRKKHAIILYLYDDDRLRCFITDISSNYFRNVCEYMCGGHDHDHYDFERWMSMGVGGWGVVADSLAMKLEAAHLFFAFFCSLLYGQYACVSYDLYRIRILTENTHCKQVGASLPILCDIHTFHFRRRSALNT